MLKQLYLKVGQCLILVTKDRTFTEGQDFREGLVLARTHRYGLVARKVLGSKLTLRSGHSASSNVGWIVCERSL